MKLGELVEKLAALQAELEESQEAYRTLQAKAEGLDQQLSEQSRSKADMKEQLAGLVKEKEEVLLLQIRNGDCKRPHCPALLKLLSGAN